MSNAFETVTSTKGLQAAWKDKGARLVSSCFGVDRVTGQNFRKTLKPRLAALSEHLREGYKPQGLLAIAKPKEGGGNRIICVPTVADRLVQFSMLRQLQPRLKAAGLDNPVSFGLAPGKAKSVIGARQFACSARAELGWVYKTDIHKFFDNVNRPILRSAVDRAVPQRSLRPLLNALLETEISDGLEPGWKKIVFDAGIRPGLGVRQGMPLSPFFAGAYLQQLDKWLVRRGVPAARYVDDIVVFFADEKSARSFHPYIVEQMHKIGLAIGDIDDPSSKTNLYSPEQPADFLGMEIRPVSQGYKLCVSDRTVQKVGEKFGKLSTVSGLMEREVQLTTLSGFLNALRQGYRNAYDGAHNIDEFISSLDSLCDGVKNTVLFELFGDKLEVMSATQRKFVGIE